MLTNVASLTTLALLFGLASASPVLDHSPLAARQDSDEPCGRLSNLAVDNNTLLPADLTLSCLRSVPLARDADALQLVGLRAFVQFQSDVEYLQDPPEGWIYPAVDLMRGLDTLESGLQSGTYDNEYDFQLDIFKLLSSAYDGHLSYVPDIVGVFIFDRLQSREMRDDGSRDWYSIFSVSSDGNNLPEVYAYKDAAALRDNSPDYDPSPLTEIDGVDVETWLNSYASQNGILGDPDANYNFNFRNVPGISSPGPRGDTFAASRYYQGNATTFAFANGTQGQTINAARLMANQTLEGVYDGASFFRKFCNASLSEKLQDALSGSGSTTIPIEGPATTTQVPYEAIPTDRNVKPPSEAYPSPIAALDDGSIAGYFPESQDDLVVLAIPSFLTSFNQFVEFENTVREVLATASANGKTRLVIDLRGNPGGSVFLPYDTFRQLFPDMFPYGAGNYRTHPLFDFIGQIISDYIAEGGFSSNSQVSQLLRGAALIPFNYRQALTADNETFSSWDDLYGPEEHNGGNFTNLVRFDLEDVARTEVPIYGFAGNDGRQPRTFEAENIILLQDGVCASACAIFSEFMKTQAGVRSIVVGGRKQNGPMQGVGGTKGSQVLPMLQLYALLAAAGDVASTQNLVDLLRSQDSDVVDGVDMALSRTSNIAEASVNFRNNIREDDDSVTPLQFVYEAADCRFFYTAEMYSQQEAIWDRAYEWAWGDGDVCVEGSTGEESSKQGVGYFNSTLPDEATNFFGGNRTVYPNETLGAATGDSSSSGGNGDDGQGRIDYGDDSSSGNDDDDSGDDSDTSGAAVGAWPRLTSAVVSSFVVTMLTL